MLIIVHHITQPIARTSYGSFGLPEKTFSINFTKVNAKFCLSLHYNVDDSYFFVNEKKSLSLKLAIKM